MIPVFQTRTGKNGNCFQAAVASILELSLEDVPDFCNSPGKEAEWFLEFCDWLKPRGLAAILCAYDQDDKALLRVLSGVTFIAGGKSASSQGVMHAVIWRDGAMLHDPNPTGKGLVGNPVDATLIVLRDGKAVRG